MVMQKKTRLYCDHDGIILCFYCVLLVNGLFFFPSFYRHHHQSKESGGTVTAGKYSCCGLWRVLLFYILVDVCTRILSLLLLEWVYTYLHIAIARLI